MTLDVDLAIARDIPPAEESLHERLAHDFRDEFEGGDRPPVTRYCLRNSAFGFYAEFLTPLVGSEVTRSGHRNVTKRILGVSAQALRHLDVLMVSPRAIPLSLHENPVQVLVANPVSYIVQKLLVHARRKSDDRSKDVLYIHDTLTLFAGSLPVLYQLWCDGVRPSSRFSTEPPPLLLDRRPPDGHRGRDCKQRLGALRLLINSTAAPAPVGGG
jgi:hypothetical protein